MREPASNGPTNPLYDEAPAPRAVSIPDRRRIDSDVRAFLREPSTPWIVFDQEGRPPSQLAIGEVLTVALSSVMPDHGFFPATAVIDAAQASYAARPEPSSLAVASDLAADARGEDEPVALPMHRARGRFLKVAAVAAGALSVLAIAVLASSSADDSVAMPKTRSAAASSPVAADVPPPDLDVKPTEALSASAVNSPAATTPASDPAKRFGRLSIAGDARLRDVFLDGKRLLGRGARSFTVMCGPHSIAVGARSDAHDLDVPCNAELVLASAR